MAQNYKFTFQIKTKRSPIEKCKDKLTHKKYIGVCLKIDNKWHVRLNEKDSNSEYYVLPITDTSLSLKGKIFVFLKDKDKYNHNICIIRSKYDAIISPGIPEQYDVLKEGLVISGYIRRINKTIYFDYVDLIAYSEHAYQMNNILEQ